MDLTIAQLAERTGVATGTLRMWEARYEFPRPSRLPSGHRRYSEGDVELIARVLRQRDEGLSLGAAIERVRREDERLPASIYAGLRDRRPELTAFTLRKPALLAITRAIEDERCASGASGVMLGSFQREAFYRQTEHRWSDVARTADVAVALADFGSVREDPGHPIEVPIAEAAPLAREWALVSEAPEARGCVAAWELPSDRPLPDAERRFEVLLSAEPEVVRTAIEVAAELILPWAPATAVRVREAASGTVAASLPELRAASALTQRMVGYLGDC